MGKTLKELEFDGTKIELVEGDHYTNNLAQWRITRDGVEVRATALDVLVLVSAAAAEAEMKGQ